MKQIIVKKFENNYVIVLNEIQPADIDTIDTLCKQEQLIFGRLSASSIMFSNTVFKDFKKIKIDADLNSLTTADIINDEDVIDPLSTEVLIHQKIKALLLVNKVVNDVRREYAKTTIQQDKIYTDKLYQAELVVSGRTENVEYVQIDADRFNISLLDAANNIINAARESNAYLVKTEKERLLVRKSIINAQNIVDLNKTFNNFYEQIRNVVLDEGFEMLQMLISNSVMYPHTQHNKVDHNIEVGAFSQKRTITITL